MPGSGTDNPTTLQMAAAAAQPRPIRILHVAPFSATTISGPARSVRGQMAAEYAAGLEILFLQSWEGPAPSLPPGVRRIEWKPSGLLERGGLMKNGALPCVAPLPDIVHFHSVYLPLHARLARSYGALGVVAVSSPRGGLMPGALARSRWKKSLANRLYFRAFCRSLVLHRALSEAERTACEGFAPEVRVEVVPNPIKPAALEPRPLRGRAPGLPHVGFLGRLDPANKGLDLLLEGMAETRLSGRPVPNVTIAGPDHRKGLRTINRMIRVLGLQDHVVVRPEYPPDGVGQFFKSVDLFVHPSRHEGMPMAVLEAMAWALPVAVTPQTNLGGIVESHGAGWVIPPVAAAWAGFLGDLGALRHRLGDAGAAALRAVEAEFNPGAVGQQLAGVYERILRSSQRKAGSRAES